MEEKKVVITGRLVGTGKNKELRAELVEKTTVKIIEEPVVVTVITIKDMLEDDYRDMVSPLLNLFRKKRGVK